MPMKEFLSMFLGREVTVYFKNKRVQKLTLKEIHLVDEEEDCKIKQSSIKVEDSVGFAREILTDNIEAIDFGIQNTASQNKADGAEIEKVKALVKEKNNVALGVRFDSLAVFENEVVELKKKLGKSIINDFLSVDKISKVSMGESDYDYLIKEFQKVSEQLDIYTYLVGEVILSLEARRYKNCIARCMELLKNDGCDKAKIYFTLSFITNQIRDYDQSFYWLERYFMEQYLTKEEQCLIKEETGVQITEDNELWWKYLFHTVEFCSYENLGDLLKQIYENDKRLCVRSLSYVLALNNLTVQAAYIWGQLERMLMIEWEELESVYRHLRSESDNKYHRFLRCVSYIQEKEQYRVYEEDEKLEGLVYDYIPYKGYGYILGFDLIKYFFHSVEVDSFTLKNIRKEICNMSHVSEEKLCQVAFSRTAETKRSYEAFNIV